MTLPTSGNSISFSQIRTEFGGPTNNINLGSYYSLDTGIPASGTIKFSDFFSKTINATRTIGSTTDFNARTDFQTNASIVGGKKTANDAFTQNQPIKYYLTISNGSLISASSAGSNSFDTGVWPAGTVIYLTNNGSIVGAGGAGGNRSGGGGFTGGTALRAQITTQVTNNGTIAGGGGGGGAGSDASQSRCREEAHCYQRCYSAFAAGGGGGGGAGSNAGPGGSGSPGYNGSAGTLNAGGAGGVGYTAVDGIASATSSGGASGGNLGENGGTSAGGGGLAGFYLDGSGNVTWISNGTRLGRVN